MNYTVGFHYKGPDASRPDEKALIEPEEFEGGWPPLLPDVGDSLTLYPREGVGNEPGLYKVLNRHFAYHTGVCYISVVITDISSEEMAERIA
ncbi:MAG: hypothetical protein JWL77_5276 [Chthonomonadaceae bacterium]|nr:hypothetical protein [Chthonomonadaceae bacterium]